MTALPLATQVTFQDNKPALHAYQLCLDFERHASKDSEINIDRIQVDIIHARLLGYLIIHAPSVIARDEIVKEIHSLCRHAATYTYEDLSRLGECFVKYFIRPFKRTVTEWRTTASSSHSSRSSRSIRCSSDMDDKDLLSTIKDAPNNHREAKRQALIRDGFRCVVTGLYDNEARHVSTLNQEAIKQIGCVNTECAHIVPQSTYFDVSTTESTSSPEKDYSTSVLAVLKGFGYDVDNLNGAKVHSLYNVMTMQHDVHDWFNRLEVWFEETEVKNTYHIKTFNEYIRLPVETVTLTSPDPILLPFPSPELLALHATCAKVAYLSGAGEYIDEIDQDLDYLDVLASDGGSSEVLSHALLRSLSSVGLKESDDVGGGPGEGGVEDLGVM